MGLLAFWLYNRESKNPNETDRETLPNLPPPPFIVRPHKDRDR